MDTCVPAPPGTISTASISAFISATPRPRSPSELDPRQRPYFWIEEAQDDWELVDRSDHQAVRDGYVSVTPLQPDLTDHSAMTLVEALTQHAAAGVK